MKKFFFIFFIFISFSVFAQNIVVLDSATNHPLENVVVTSLNPNKIVVTNRKGMVNITDFQNAKKIEIRLVGYQTVNTNYQKINSNQFIVKLQSLYFNLDEVVVSATRWQQAQNRISAKIFHIRNRDIELFNPQTTADLLGISGKVYIQKSQLAGGSPIIRGLSTNRLLYTVDGVRMNTAIFRSGNLQNVISLDPFSIQKTEILLGANSVIYGSDAIGGVMSFQTLQPQFSLTDKTLIKGRFVSRYSTANQERTGHFDVNIGWKKWAWIVGLSTFYYDHLRQGSYGKEKYLKKYIVKSQINGKDIVWLNPDARIQSPSEYSQTNWMQKIAYRPNRYWELSLATHYSSTSPYGRYDRHLRQKKGLPQYAEWNYGEQRWTMNLLKITHHKSNMLYDEFTTRWAFQQFDESRIVRKLNAQKRETNTEKVNAFSVNADFKKMLTDKHTLYYGAEWVGNRVISKGVGCNILTDSTWSIASRYPQSWWQSLATYVNVQLRLTDKWTVQSGLRYNYYQIDGNFNQTTRQAYQFPFDKIKNSNANLTGSIGATYRLPQKIILSTNVSTGFRSPNVDDMGKVFDFAQGFVVVPNPKLRSEYATNVDVSLVKVFSNRFKLDFTTYYTHLKNVLSIDNFQLNGQDTIVYKGDKCRVQALQNRAKAFVYGVQLSGELKLSSAFRLSTDINYQKGTEVHSNSIKSTLRHAVPLFGNTKLIYQNDGLSLQLYANYQAEMKSKDMPQSEQKKVELYALDSEGKAYAPSWCTLNFKTNYQFSKKILLGVGIENMTDLRYRPYLSGISSAGRNVILSIQLKF